MFIIFLVGILGAIASAMLGTFWYSMATPMGHWHMQYLGFDKLTKARQEKKMKDAMPGMWKLYGAQLLLSMVTSLFIGATAYFTAQNGGQASAVFFYVPSIWIAFTVPLIGQALLWGDCSASLAWKKFFSDSSFNLIANLVTAVIAFVLIK